MASDEEDLDPAGPGCAYGVCVLALSYFVDLVMVISMVLCWYTPSEVFLHTTYAVRLKIKIIEETEQKQHNTYIGAKLLRKKGVFGFCERHLLRRS